MQVILTLKSKMPAHLLSGTKAMKIHLQPECCLYLRFYLFWVSGVWTHGFKLEPHTQHYLVFGIFEIGSGELFAGAGLDHCLLSSEDLRPSPRTLRLPPQQNDLKIYF
jgi:hypothetical protein